MNSLRLLCVDRIVKHLLKHEHLILDNFNVQQDSPANYILRMADKIFLDEKVIEKVGNHGRSYSMPSLFASLKTNCLTCEKRLIVKKNIQSMLYDEVLGSVKITIISKYCSDCKHIYYPGYFENFSDHLRQYYDGWESYGIFVSTIYSSFSIDLLDRLICLKQKCHTTFMVRLLPTTCIICIATLMMFLTSVDYLMLISNILAYYS